MSVRNFRLFLLGQFLTNTGTWVQRIAQDWLVLSLTGNPVDVGFTIALQFLPTLLFGMVGGLLADRYSKRLILMITQIGMATTAGVLTVLALTGVVQVWHVFVLAFCMGSFAAVDVPTRHSFVNEIVGGARLTSAISLNSALFQVGALVGPALSGFSIELFGVGYSFLFNTLSFLGPIIALSLMDPSQLLTPIRIARRRTLREAGAQIRDGWRYATSHAVIWWVTMLIGVTGVVISALPVTLTIYASEVFRTGASGYGLLSAVLASGSVVGAALVAARARLRLRTIFGAAMGLGVLYLAAGLSANPVLFNVLLAGIGLMTMNLVASANSVVQLTARDDIRGRVVSIYMMVFLTSGAVGGPLIGWIDGQVGPQGGMIVSGTIALLASIVFGLRLVTLLRRSSGDTRSWTSWRRVRSEPRIPDPVRDQQVLPEADD